MELTYHDLHAGLGHGFFDGEVVHGEVRAGQPVLHGDGLLVGTLIVILDRVPPSLG